MKDFKLRKGVIKGIKLLQKKNFYLFIVTNQAGIAKKKFTELNLKNFH
jgi:histidinol phosphatase-like enzyme